MIKKSFYGLTISLLALLFISCASLPGGMNANSKFNRKYETVAVDDKQEYLQTKIRYPKFDGLPELNKRIENTVLSNWRSFKSYSKEEWEEISALNSRGKSKLPPFEYNVSCEVTGTKNIVSVLLNTYIFSGGAHGSTTLTTINYDISKKSYINILQATNMTYKEISSVARNQLYKKLIDNNKALPLSERDSIREMINTGAFPQPGNFGIFTVDGIKVYAWFEPYSVAPYSYGIQKVQVK